MSSASQRNLLRETPRTADSKRPLTLKTNAFQSNRKVELFIECTDLEQLDSFSKSDPLCVVSVRRLGQWTEYGRTESIPNILNPKVKLQR